MLLVPVLRTERKQTALSWFFSDLSRILERSSITIKPFLFLVGAAHLYAADGEAPADSANVIGEIPSSEKPEEVVVLGGHIDSWDVGQGAQDDGSGIMASLAAVALIQKLGLHPRRAIRVVFWTNEENGSVGGKAYREWLGDKVKNHVAAIEKDGGARWLREVPFLQRADGVRRCRMRRLRA